MAATKLSRPTLDNLFSDGERPTGENFASAWLSFLHQNDDGLSYDGKNLVISSTVGITLGNPSGGPGGTPGTLRFNGSQVQYYDPGVNDFKDISGGAGAFLPVGAGPDVSYGAGKVGIGAFTSASPPTHLLEIQLGDNTGPAQQVLFGNLVVHNGPVTKSGAYIGNKALSANTKGFALFQDNTGKTTLNATSSAGSHLSLAIDGEDKFLIDTAGNIQLSPTSTAAPNSNVTILGDVNIGSGFSPTPNQLRIFGDGTGVKQALIVNGVAAKTGSLVWVLPASDERIKKEVRPYKEGLDKIIQFKPVVYKYNGKGGIPDNGQDTVGLIAQDLQKVAPEMVFSMSAKLNTNDKKDTDLLNYDFHNVLFMFINAFKEVNTRIEKLEKPKK